MTILSCCDASSTYLVYLPQAEKQRELAALRFSEEERLASVLAARDRDQMCRDRELQQLREQSSELRA